MNLDIPQILQRPLPVNPNGWDEDNRCNECDHFPGVCRCGWPSITIPGDRSQIEFVPDPRVHKRSQKNLADRSAREVVVDELKSFDSVTIRSIRAAHPDVDVKAVRRYLRELLKLRRVTREGNTYYSVKK